MPDYVDSQLPIYSKPTYNFAKQCFLYGMVPRPLSQPTAAALEAYLALKPEEDLLDKLVS